MQHKTNNATASVLDDFVSHGCEAGPIVKVQTIRRVNFGVLAFGLLSELGVFLWDKAISLDQIFNVITLEVALWTIAPFVVMTFVAWFCASGRQVSRLPTIVSLLAALLLVGFGVLELLNALVIHADTESGLTLVLLPIVQLKGALILGAICVVLKLAQAIPKRHKGRGRCQSYKL